MDEIGIEAVDNFGEELKDALVKIGEECDWGVNFTLAKAPGSDYWRSQVIAKGEPVRKNWLQLNGQTYSHPSYSSPKPWKLLARFGLPPSSPLWEKKPAYVRNRHGREYSPGGLDVWAIAYESLLADLHAQDRKEVMAEILSDLKSSWTYSNIQELEQVVSSSEPQDRVQVTLSINSEIWGDFQRASSRDYRPRRNHPKRPSYAKLREEAIDEALLDYTAKHGSRDVNDHGDS